MLDYACANRAWRLYQRAATRSADGVHLSSASPCIGAGTNVVIGTDIFGQAWANPPSIGCAEYNPSPTVSQPQVTLTGEPAGFQIGNVALGGQPPFAFIWLENGVPLQNNGQFSSTQSSNLVATGVSLADAGNYQLVVSNAFGMATSTVAQLVIHAVDAAGLNPEPPFLTWDTAATNIQDAINAASAGDIVLVTNGLYATGGQSMDGVITNRVTLNNALMVVSVNGYANTAIQGAWDPVSTNGPAAVRCAWLTNGAVLSGFALQNGATGNAGTNANSFSGGGVWCASTNAVVSYCLLTNNAATDGGGIAFGTLDNSLVVGNVATDGGGSYYATLNNCLVVSNLATYGGGAYNSTLNNCTVVENSNTNLTFSPVPTYGAGTYYGLTQNSIVLNNYDYGGNPDNYVLGPGSVSLFLFLHLRLFRGPTRRATATSVQTRSLWTIGKSPFTPPAAARAARFTRVERISTASLGIIRLPWVASKWWFQTGSGRSPWRRTALFLAL